jgi:undecaprenyl diphosphate synthase
LDRHPSAAFPKGGVPNHVAIVMDGNGRWANRRGLTRIEGHRAGEEVLLDVVAGAIQAGVKHLSVYAFSTENWARSPEEVRFLMGYNRDVLHRRRDQLNEWGVRIRWAGRKPRLWGSVIKELQYAEQLTAGNDTLTLTMCINYGGRHEIVDAMRAMGEQIAAGRLKPSAITEKTVRRHLYVPDMPDVDLFLRSSGEQRTSNFLLWEAAYAEMVFLDTLWPTSRARTSGTRSSCTSGAVAASAAPSTRRRPISAGNRSRTREVAPDMTDKITIDVWSDIACPWCYIGKRNLEAASHDGGGPRRPAGRVTFHSFELSPDTPVDFEGDELDFLAGHKGMPRERVRRCSTTSPAWPPGRAGVPLRPAAAHEHGEGPRTAALREGTGPSERDGRAAHVGLLHRRQARRARRRSRRPRRRGGLRRR